MVGLIGNILIKKYPDFKEQIPFNELLDWHFWPRFMTIIGTYSKVEYLTVICSIMYCGTFSALRFTYGESFS